MAQLPTPSVRLTRRTLIVALAVLFVVSVSVLILLKVYFNLAPNTPGMEVFKAVLQLGVISVAAAAIALLSFNYQFERQREQKEREELRQSEQKEREELREDLQRHRDDQQKTALRNIELLRQQLEYREELLRNVLSRAVDAYSAVKKARRVLRALAVHDTGKGIFILTERYDAQMDVINDAQLDFENLQRDVKNSEDAFPHPDQIVKSLQSIDKYLGRLIKEYERERPTFREPFDFTKPLSELEHLSDFLASSKTTELFMKEVVKPFHDVQQFIREDLLNPKLLDIESLIQSEGAEANTPPG